MVSCFRFTAMASVKKVLVYGGKGALGSTCVKAFKAKNWVRCTSCPALPSPAHTHTPPQSCPGSRLTYIAAFLNRLRDCGAALKAGASLNYKYVLHTLN